jgi:hypothetical protein
MLADDREGVWKQGHPVKYDNPLNDYIRHVPFFRRSEVFPYHSGNDSTFTPNSNNRFVAWLVKMKTLDDWDGSVSDVKNTERWIPTTLPQ